MKKKMQKKDKRKCIACGKYHDGKECPLIKAKMDKFYKQKATNFLMGNIFLECIKKEKDFLQILLEIAEMNEEICEVLAGKIMPLDSIIEYFALSLGCKSSDFFKKPRTTADEYKKLIQSGYIHSYDVDREDNGKVYSINFYINIDSINEVNIIEGDFFNIGYTFALEKTLINNKWRYYFVLNLPIDIKAEYQCQDKEKYPYGRRYFWKDMTFAASDSIVLMYEEEGFLKEFFEHELDKVWYDDELIVEYPYSDSRFEIWMTKLNEATVDGILEWKKHSEHSFSSKYGHIEIKIAVNLEPEFGDRDLLYVRNQDGGLGMRFGHRKHYDTILGPEDGDGHIVVSNENLRIKMLAARIEKDIENKKNINLCDVLNTKEILHTDVVVVTQSMICKKQDHTITPLRGIVQLLTPENEQISYEIYVGFCQECNQYYVFRQSYFEMIKNGKPLCAVYHEELLDEKKSCTPFRYKSQSVLNAMGYSVGMENALSSNERQKILVEALQSDLFDIHDLLDFLNWLIRTRETQTKYRNAVSKWREDAKFVENYDKNNRNKVKIDSITIH